MSSEVKQSQKSYLEKIFDIASHAFYLSESYKCKIEVISVDIFYECAHWASDRREELINYMQELFN